ncbi:MAG: hypothetical protein ACI9DJ_002210, partial [Algoriphagus sp.]
MNRTAKAARIQTLVLTTIPLGQFHWGNSIGAIPLGQFHWGNSIGAIPLGQFHWGNS